MPNEASSPATKAPTSPAAPEPSPHPRPRRVWLAALLTPHWATAAFTAMLALATLALVWTTNKQHAEAVDAIEATNRLATATESAASDRRHMASAEFILKMDDTLDQQRFDKITDDIQLHNSNFHLPKYRDTTDADVEEYIGVFDYIGYFIRENLIEQKMAYEEFSPDIEKAWCNVTVQETIYQERATDKSRTAQIDPVYGDFEKQANDYLKIDGLSCKDLDTATTPAAKKKLIKRNRRTF
jgi:hypothetical protein